MISLSHIEGFQWDEGNLSKSWNKHGVTHSEVEQLFTNKPLLLLNDEKHSEGEARYHAYGKSNEGRLLQSSFTVRGSLIRVISARPMSKRERMRYAEEA